METATRPAAPATSAIDTYRAMLGARIAEKLITDLATQGELGGHHSGLNHEAIGIGVGLAVEFDDVVQTSYRSGATVKHARGLTLRELVLQGFGLIPGAREQHPGGARILRSTGIVAGQMPMAVGIAMAFKLQRKPNVVVTFIGDGASNEGAVHESMNIAGVKLLPIVFVVENNGLGLSNRMADSTRAANLADRGAGYGIEAHTVDGSDVAAVHGAAAAAVARARTRSLPTILELKTTRPGPHATRFADPRTEEELAAARAADCIAFERERLIAAGVWDPAADAALVAELQGVVDEAVAEARAARAVRLPTATARYTDAEAWELAHATPVPSWMRG